MVALEIYKTRQAKPEDRLQLAYLAHFETYVHRHLDYRPPLDWIGSQPFHVLEKGKDIVAALACPPDPPKVAWLRFFAIAHQQPAEAAWEALWPHAYTQLKEEFQPTWSAAIPMQHWFTALLEKSGFKCTHYIVMLSWDAHALPAAPVIPGVNLRPMALEDLGLVQAVDEAAFTPIWQNSQFYLEIAFRQAALATVAELDGRIVAYQISTPTPLGGHLARLAVLPQLQSQGIGYVMLHSLLTQFNQRGARTITVNTQKDNHASLNLYMKAGFYLTGEEYPIYQLAF